MLKKICNTLSSLIVAVMAALVFVLYVVNIFGIRTYTVLTGSMEPKYPVGSVVYVIPSDGDNLKVGDVISFTLESGLVATHRVYDIRADERKIVTKGDNNNASDDPISYDSVIGKVVLAVPYLGYVATWLGTVAGKIVLIGIFAFALLLMAIPDFFKKESKIESNEEGGKHETQESR